MRCTVHTFACQCREEKFIRIFEELLWARKQIKRYENFVECSTTLIDEIESEQVGRTLMNDLDIAYYKRQWDNAIEELEKDDEQN